MAVLVGTVFVFTAPRPARACWEEYPRAERAFREGIEAFTKGDYALAIERFREARDARREPDASCTVQIYGRGPESKAYYLPYFYLARAFYLGGDQLLDSDNRCPDAIHYMTMSLERREETYDVYRRRFRNELAEMDELREACAAEASETQNLTSAPAIRHEAGSMTGGGR